MPKPRSGSLVRSPGLPDVEANGESLPVDAARRRTPLRCFLGFHDLGQSGVGHCARGCGYYLTGRVGNGGWVRHTTKPDDAKRPTGLPPA